MSTHFAQLSSKPQQVRPLDSPYLEVLSDIPTPPAKLYYLGSLPEKRLPTAAIIGSRKPTSYGREVTIRLADALARRGVVIISGLALGIDAIAHQAALDASGTTIAIQANGLHELSPRSNRLLGENIIRQGGAIISEYEPGLEAMKHQFLARNRLVSGLSDIIIVTEAAARSGTLNTAAHAAEQGREVYAVPGNITSPMSAGCNRLIAQGARPLLDIDELLAELLPTSAKAEQQVLPIGQTDLENTIISALASGERDADTILATSDATPAELNAAITMLEINGVIKPLGANRWSLR